jgi:hypothetical protein
MKRLSALILAAFFASTNLPLVGAAVVPTVQLNEMSPEWINRAIPIQLTLEIDSDSNYSQIPIAVNLSSTPLVGRSQIADVLSKSSSVAMREVVSTTSDVQSGINLISVRVPAAQLQNLSSGAYVVEVQVRFPERVRLIQTLLPVLKDQTEVLPVETVLLWQISSTPSSFQDGQYLNQKTIEQFGPTGSVSISAATATGRSGLSLLVDPATVVDAQRISNGGSALDETDVSGEQSAAALAFLTTLNEQLLGQNFYFLPYAQADLNGLWVKNQKAIATAAMTQLDLDLSTLPQALGTAVIPTGGDFGGKVWERFPRRMPDLVVVNSDHYPGTQSTYTPSGVVRLPNFEVGLVADLQASKSLSVALTDAKAVLGRQAVLADTLMFAMERPNLERVLVMSPNTTNPAISLIASNRALDALVVPWVTPISIGEALTKTPTDERIRESDPSKRTFSDSTLKVVWELNRVRKAFTPVVLDSIHAREFDAIRARLVSTKLRDKNEVAASLKAAEDFSKTFQDSIRIVSAGSVAFAGETGVIPITIQNKFSVPVTVQLNAVGVPAVRVSTEPIPIITIKPGQRKSVELPTTLRGSDVAYLDLQLKSLRDVPLNSVVRIQISSSAYSQIAGYVVYGAFGLLLLLIVNNTVRRIRKRNTPSGDLND